MEERATEKQQPQDRKIKPPHTFRSRRSCVKDTVPGDSVIIYFLWFDST